MTYTLNGIGTQLCGERSLNHDEIEKWAEHLPYSPRRTTYDYKIATESFVLLFLPVVPLKTFIFHHTGDNHYVIDFFPTGEESVYWGHVKKSPVFYVAPAIISIIIIWSIIFYPNQELIVKGITESTEAYSVMKSYNSTQTYYEDQTYLDYECEMHDEFRDMVEIPVRGDNDIFVDGYDFFYETSNYLNCIITNYTSSKTVNFRIKASYVRNMDLTYPILIAYYPIDNCESSYANVSLNPPIVEYGKFLVKLGESYEGTLSYKQVFDLRPKMDNGSERLTAFMFIVGTPQWCRQVEKVKQVEKTRPIKITKNETLYRSVFKEDNLTLKISFFQKWTLGKDIHSYGCPSPYNYGEKNSCYRKV